MSAQPESNLTVSRVMRAPDNTVKVIRHMNSPHLKQFTLVSKKSTVNKLNPTYYVVKIETDTPVLSPHSKIKVYCSCLDFRYRQAYCFHREHALISTSDYVIEEPTTTNPNCIIKACKHINAALKYGLEKRI